jgi:predicted nucleic acid-binding protein
MRQATKLFMPFFVLAELRLGAARSTEKTRSLEHVEILAGRCQMLFPNESTIGPYVRARQRVEQGRSLPYNSRKREGLNHDLWIAALCVQHKLPLLSNDRDFDGIEGLEVIHW